VVLAARRVVVRGCVPAVQCLPDTRIYSYQARGPPRA
jgi:hypothetical protein